MADMPNDFWGGWIAVLTIVSLLGLAWLVFSVYFSDTGPQEAETQVWDGTLREGSSAAPMWWFWMILVLMVFSVGYLMLYPGLGSFKGVLQWSQGGHLEHSTGNYEARFGQLRRDIAVRAIGDLQNDAAIMRSAQRIYDRNCAVCHGYDGAGQASTFPNLTDNNWQWGGSAEQIEQSIRAGRNAVMVGWAPVLGDQGVLEVAQYVLAMGEHDEMDHDPDGGRPSGQGVEPGIAPAVGHPGETRYRQFCLGCHGAKGEGNPVLGAPNLVDDVWLYGDSEADLRHSIGVGRNGVMPAFGSRLDDTQIRMLVAWLTRAP